MFKLGEQAFYFATKDRIMYADENDVFYFQLLYDSTYPYKIV